MELKVTMQLNPVQRIEAIFAGANIQDAIKAAGCLLDFEGECGNCKGKNISLETRAITSKKDNKTYKYTEYVCRECKWTKPWGAYQDGTGFFLKTWKEAYKGTEPQDNG